MSDSNAPTHLQPSSELVRWLQSLALPAWARGLLVIVLVAVMVGGLAMVGWATLHQERETMTAGVGLLTMALPISLLVIGLVFGQRSEQRLNRLTENVLDALIPTHLERIVCAPRGMKLDRLSRSGCRATYVLSSSVDVGAEATSLKFSVELNVRKVNLMFGMPRGLVLQQPLEQSAALRPYRHVVAGARAEGYQLNSEPAHYAGNDGGMALLFFRPLPEDFLLRPIEKLYFAQDLGFFVRGMLEAQASVAATAKETA
jgi:hypothetical protein